MCQFFKHETIKKKDIYVIYSFFFFLGVNYVIYSWFTTIMLIYKYFIVKLKNMYG